MKLSEIERLDKGIITCKQACQVLGTDEKTLHWTAIHSPERLGFPILRFNNRIKIPRMPFIKFMRGDYFREDDKIIPNEIEKSVCKIFDFDRQTVQTLETDPTTISLQAKYNVKKLGDPSIQVRNKTIKPKHPLIKYLQRRIYPKSDTKTGGQLTVSFGHK